MKKTKRPVKSKEELLMAMSAKKFAAMRISACWIVKDEAENLRRSIERIKDHVDEMIVVDTGSTDDTVKVASELGAQVLHFDWINDFSAARNFALEHATGDWIVFLDADEFFPSNAASSLRQSIQLAVQRKKTALLIELVNIDVDKGGEVIDSTYLCRVFKRGFHYVGRIHEELRDSDGRAPTKTLLVPDSVMQILHTGYSSGVNREKAERNLKMLLAELDSTDEPERIYGYLAQCYNGIDDFDNAEKYARLDIERGAKDSTFASSSHRILIKILSSADVERIDERLSEAQQAVSEFPHLPEFRAELAECYAAKGQYDRAIREMRTALKNFENYQSYRVLEPTTFTQAQADFAEDRIDRWSVM